MTSSLDQWDQEDEERKAKGSSAREVMRPKVPARTKPVVVAKKPETKTDPETPAAEGPKAKTVKEPAAPVLFTAGFKIDNEVDSLIESGRTAGREASPRINADRSEVVRLAVRELFAKNAPEKVAEKLRRARSTGRASA